MARIDPELLERLKSKLGIGNAALYQRIQQAANKHMLERPEAALALAAELNVNISKYATREQRSQIAAARVGGRHTPAHAVASAPAEKARAARKAGKTKRSKGNNVFVVVGRNSKINKSLFQFLRALGLSPIEWERARTKTGKANPYIGEILEVGFKMAAAVVVLMTPDDEAKLRDELLKDDDDHFERNLSGQARPNVLFEAGYAMGRYPENTVLVTVGKLRPFSDISGRHVVRLTTTPESRHAFVGRLRAAGLDASTDGSDWLSEGSFSL